MKMVSIIVPVYKTEERIRTCIESVISQTYTDFELLLVDDGSPDGSGKICDAYANTDNRIRVIHKENGGVGSARNVGLQQAIGEYITFLDSDDTWDKDFLENAVNKIGQNDLYMSGIKTYGGKINSNHVSSISAVLTPREFFEKVFVAIPQIYICGPCCKLIKSSVIKNGCLFSLSLRCGEDTDFNLSYMRFVNTIYVDNRSYYNYYRGNENSLYSSYNPQYYSDHVAVYDKWLQLITDLNCSDEAVMRFQQKYAMMLMGNISTAFIHKRSKKEIKSIIKLLSQDKMIKKRMSLKWKNGIIKFLLKCKFVNAVYFFYWLYYKTRV